MTQQSYWWTTNATPTGHQVAEYTQLHLSTISAILAATNGQDGVAPGWASGELSGQVTGANTVQISAGDEVWLTGLAIQEVLSQPAGGCRSADLVLSTPQDSAVLQETSGRITSSQAISGTGILVEYDAGTGVALQSGFRVGAGASLRIGTEGCG